ncbi:FAD-binding oxidoreductase [Polyangium mundeleinium]|uniref:FAD-binding oxidoreductase n=1 Tax=Polyangium mundeleinium TaxID=2995306 RepID=A0ABT5EG38_9BACT|nr:FAD-binding oxidoreductase [Polyangium mundeleinium]MDC0740791.1 FAD-binding oxidoreductase [Polyangium mundeleinium]
MTAHCLTSRRTFLTQTAAGALGVALLDACADTPAPVPDDIGALARSVQGTVVVPADEAYDASRLLYNTRFDAVRPLAVVKCKSASDVQKALGWARRNSVHIAARSGGHSYGGFSTTSGLVLDVRDMATIEVDTTNHTVLVGAGASLIDIYGALFAHGLALTAGTCPTVGIAGHALGGGYGLISRKFGLTSDNLLEIQLVTAAGDLLTCNDKQNTDLFWACRGGGGGQFGVVTSLKLQVYAVSEASYFRLIWGWPDAAKVVDAWQAWAPYAPDELTSLCGLFCRPGKEPWVRVIGMYLGPVAALEKLLLPMLSPALGTPTTTVVEADSYENITLMWAGCESTAAACHLAPQGTLEREIYRAKSDYVTEPLPAAAIDIMMEWVAARATATATGYILLDAYGGALSRVAPDATAFVHRAPLFSCQYLAYERPTDTPETQQENRDGLNDLHASLRPYMSGEAYQNYIDPDLADWQHAYYGGNLPRLLQVKAKYDPQNVFRFAQSLPVV